MGNRVIDVLRRFLPRYLEGSPVLHEAQRRAVWALLHCRTAVMGGRLYSCAQCGRREFAYHSCHHRACPQCGRADTAAWVENQLERRVAAPYFMVTFTVPQELREVFLGRLAREAFDAFFAASSHALRDILASPRWLGAPESGFTGILHTWNQRLLFHPHIHYLVPGAGLDPEGRFVRVKNAHFLVPVPALARRFRSSLRDELHRRDWETDPAIWTKDWGVHIQPFGDGKRAIQYLGAYVARTAIGDARIRELGDDHVSFSWKDRAAHGRIRTESVSGLEFIRRYLRHVLPRGLRSIRYYGYCHPAAKHTAQRVRFHSGRPLFSPAVAAATRKAAPILPTCPCCQHTLSLAATVPPAWSRGPPPAPRSP